MRFYGPLGINDDHLDVVLHLVHHVGDPMNAEIKANPSENGVEVLLIVGRDVLCARV